jgi:ADP-heptose:LPS heptosyltransferase
MNPGVMQLADKYIGTLLVATASLFKRKKRQPPAEIKNILLIKMFGMGSIILMAPMVKLLRKNYPSCRIHILTFTANKEIVDIYKIADKVYGLRKDSFLGLLKDAFISLIKIRVQKMDVIIDGEFFSRLTAFFSFLAAAKYNIGFYNYGICRGNLLDYRCYFNPYRHIKDNFLELARPICRIETEAGLGTAQYSPAQEKEAMRKLAELGVNFTHKLIVLNPNTSNLCPWIDRRWPADKFILLGKMFLHKGYDLVVMGARNESRYASDVSSGIGNSVLSLAGKISILELVILLDRSFLLVTNDSGPLHIAVSQDTPTFSFFGTDTPIIYGYNSPLHAIFYKGLPCSPCLSVFNFKIGSCEFDVKCIRSITPEEVTETFLKKESFLNAAFEKKWKTRKGP